MPSRSKKRKPVRRRLLGCMKPVLRLFRTYSEACRGRQKRCFVGGCGLHDFPVQGGFHAMQLDRGGREGYLASPFHSMGFIPEIRPAGSAKRLIENRKFSLEYSNGFRPSPSVYSQSFFMKSGDFLEISDVPLGRGSFGSVFVGRLTDPSGESTMVAVKNTGDPALMDSYPNYLEEMKIHELLSTDPHPNIVKIYGVNNAQSSRDLFFVLEYVPHTLYRLIHEDPSFDSYAHVLKVLHGIASALEHLHKHKIIHFDLKPQNVLVTDDLQAKVTDFGVSKFWLNQPINVSPRGTPPFMAPECRGNSCYNSESSTLSEGSRCFNVSDTADIFSFGMLALTCVTGNIKRKESVARQMLAAGEFVEVGGCEKTMEPCDSPEELRILIAECLRFDPNALDSADHGRPSATELKNRICSMQKCQWASDRLTWIS